MEVLLPRAPGGEMRADEMQCRVQRIDEASAPFFVALGAVWDDATVARWSADPFGMLWLMQGSRLRPDTGLEVFVKMICFASANMTDH